MEKSPRVFCPFGTTTSNEKLPNEERDAVPFTTDNPAESFTSYPTDLSFGMIISCEFPFGTISLTIPLIDATSPG